MPRGVPAHTVRITTNGLTRTKSLGGKPIAPPGYNTNQEYESWAMRRARRCSLVTPIPKIMLSRYGLARGDNQFVVPLRLAQFDAPLQITHAQYIDFSEGWAEGLCELLALLQELDIPRATGAPYAGLWRSVQLEDSRPITGTPERLASNWLAVESLPARIRFYDFKGGIALGKAQKAIQVSPIPVAAFNRGFFSFAPSHQLQDYFGPDLPLGYVAECTTDAFLDKGWADLHLAAHDARPKFTDLARQSFDAFFVAKGLKSVEIASGREAWWPTAARATIKRLSFNWPDGLSGSRQIVGRSDKRGFHWHLWRELLGTHCAGCAMSAWQAE